MAGIEKVCEFSGEYGGCDMYSWKRNHIQINPKYRKTFKGCKCELVFGGYGLYLSDNKGCLLSIESKQYYLNKYDNWTQEDEINYIKITYGFKRLVKDYSYKLKVFDDHLEGKVLGEYTNTSYEKGKVIRKMKRLVGNPNLKITYDK